MISGLLNILFLPWFEYWNIDNLMHAHGMKTGVVHLSDPHCKQADG